MGLDIAEIIVEFLSLLKIAESRKHGISPSNCVFFSFKTSVMCSTEQNQLRYVRVVILSSDFTHHFFEYRARRSCLRQLD